MPFPADTWENRQKEYRRQEDREEKLHRAKYPNLYREHEDDKPKAEESTVRSFNRRKRDRV